MNGRKYWNWLKSLHYFPLMSDLTLYRIFRNIPLSYNMSNRGQTIIINVRLAKTYIYAIYAESSSWWYVYNNLYATPFNTKSTKIVFYFMFWKTQKMIAKTRIDRIPLLINFVLYNEIVHLPSFSFNVQCIQYKTVYRQKKTCCNRISIRLAQGSINV